MLSAPGASPPPRPCTGDCCSHSHRGHFSPRGHRTMPLGRVAAGPERADTWDASQHPTGHRAAQQRTICPKRQRCRCRTAQGQDARERAAGARSGLGDGEPHVPTRRMNTHGLGLSAGLAALAPVAGPLPEGSGRDGDRGEGRGLASGTLLLSTGPLRSERCCRRGSTPLHTCRRGRNGNPTWRCSSVQLCTREVHVAHVLVNGRCMECVHMKGRCANRRM